MTKKILTLAVAALSAWGATAVEVPYESKIAENFNFVDGWTHVNNSRRDQGFKYDSDSNRGHGVYHAYNSDHDADCWMISPELTLTAGTEYTISYELKSKSDPERYEAYIGTGATVADLKAGVLLESNTNYTHTETFELRTVKFTPEADGDYYFGMHCNSTTSGWNFYFANFSIKAADEGGEGGEDTPAIPSSGIALPYNVEFNTAANGWTTLNGPAAGSTDTWKANWQNNWTFDTTDGIQEDHYLISPLVALNDGNQYGVRVRGNIYGKLEIGVMTDNKDCSTFQALGVIENNGPSYNAKTPILVETPGDYYIAIHAVNAEHTYMGYRLEGCTVSVDKPVPGYATELEVVASPMDELEVMLSWKMPTTDNYGNALSGLLTYEIYRNDELAVTDTEFPGALTAAMDTPAEAGIYSYYVVVKDQSGACMEELPEAVSAGYVGRPTAELTNGSWTLGFTKTASELCTFEDANADGATFYFENSSYYYSFYTVDRPDAETELDDYFCTPYLTLAPGYYKISATAQKKFNGFEIGLVSDRHDMAGSFELQRAVAAEEVDDYPMTFTAIICIDEEMDRAIGIHATGLPSDGSTLSFQLSGLKIEAVERAPLAAADLKIAQEEENTITVSWTNPTLDNAGLALTDEDKLTAKVYIDGTLAETLTDLAAGQEMSIDVAYTDGGEVEAEVEISLNGVKSDGDNAIAGGYFGEALSAPYEVVDFTEWNIMNDGYVYCPWTLAEDGTLLANDIWWAASSYALGHYIEIEAGKAYDIEVAISNAKENKDATVSLVYGTSKKSDKLSSLKVLSSIITPAATSEPITHVISVRAAGEAAAPAAREAAAAITIPAGKQFFGLLTSSEGSPKVHSFKLAENIETGIEAVEADEADAPVEYFNLQGVRVNNPAAGQLLIRRQGSKAVKVIF